MADWYVSPSRLKQYGECPRRWAFRVIARLEEPRTQALIDGTAAHEVAEAWLRDGTPPDMGSKYGRWVLEGIPFLPPPKSVQVELDWRYSIEGIPFGGRIDFARPDLRGDHKFIADARYSLTTETLPHDVQAMMYALADPSKTDSRRGPLVLGGINLLWVYYLKRKRGAFPVHVHVDRAAVFAEFRDRFMPAAREMTVLKSVFAGVPPAAVIDPINRIVPCNTANCLAYGKACPYSKQCTHRSPEMTTPDTAALLAQLAAARGAAQPAAPAAPVQPAAPAAPVQPAAPAQAAVHANLMVPTEQRLAEAAANAGQGLPPADPPPPPGVDPKLWNAIAPEKRAEILAQLNPQPAGGQTAVVNPPEVAAPAPPTTSVVAPAQPATPAPDAEAPEAAKKRGRPKKADPVAEAIDRQTETLAEFCSLLAQILIKISA